MDKEWKSKIRRKQARGNQTAGSQKGENCKAKTIDRFFTKRSRSYKHQDYPEWLNKVIKGQKF